MAQIGKCKGKYLGNITAYSVPSGYTDLWNQTTSENGSKWGSCDRGDGEYDFRNSDLAYNTAKNSNGAFKFHALIWGAQAPAYLKDAEASTIETAIRNWIQAVDDHYTPMGGLKIIDVLNEPVNTPIDREVSNLKEALTLGYQSEDANQGDLDNPYGWAIWPFQLARKHFPDATLLINEFNVEMNWNNCRAEYIKMSKAIKNAPNLTDGSKNIIDGIGLQAHGINNLTGENFKACIDELWNSTGLPVHITEIDITADPDEATQLAKYKELLPVAWEHEHVAGVTLWGYIQGSTWVPGNKEVGPSGTGTGIVYSANYTEDPLGDRPAMTWIKEYFASQESLACCPDPGPFANCAIGIVPTVEFISPTELTLVAPATVTFDVKLEDLDGDIAHVDFYLNDEIATIHEEWVAPYAWDMEFFETGTYQMKAIAYDNDGNTDEDIITIEVNVPQIPYGGVAHSIPGKIEFENYDLGGNGFAYADSSQGNDATANYRTDEDVDIEDCFDTGLGFNLGWTKAREWLEYTVDVNTAGKYDLVIRAACNGEGRTVSLAVDGVDIASDIVIPNTKGWQEWEDVTVEGVVLQAGEQVIRLTIGDTDYVNLNYMEFVAEPVGPTLLTEGWNLIGCPLEGSTSVQTVLSTVWDQVITVQDMDGFYNTDLAPNLNSLYTLDWGKGYLVKVKEDCSFNW